MLEFFLSASEEFLTLLSLESNGKLLERSKLDMLNFGMNIKEAVKKYCEKKNHSLKTL